MWQHLKARFRHQESLRGPHGGYLAGATGDWSDFSTPFLQMTESMLVPAQLAYAYPRLAELADLRGDHAFAAQLRTPARASSSGCCAASGPARWYSRGYSGARSSRSAAARSSASPSRGRSSPAPRAPARPRTLVANIRRFLTGIGAPAFLGGPARIGSALVPLAPTTRG